MGSVRGIQLRHGKELPQTIPPKRSPPWPSRRNRIYSKTTPKNIFSKTLIPMAGKPKRNRKSSKCFCGNCQLECKSPTSTPCTAERCGRMFLFMGACVCLPIQNFLWGFASELVPEGSKGKGRVRSVSSYNVPFHFFQRPCCEQSRAKPHEEDAL